MDRRSISQLHSVYIGEISQEEIDWKVLKDSQIFFDYRRFGCAINSIHYVITPDHVTKSCGSSGNLQFLRRNNNFTTMLSK